LRSNGLYLELSIFKKNNGRLEGQYYKQLANLGGESGLPPVLIKKIMKRYLLFCGMHYYPDGGFNDMKYSSDNLDELKELFIKGESEDYDIKYDWYDGVDEYIDGRVDWIHIYDSKEDNVINFESVNEYLK